MAQIFKTYGEKVLRHTKVGVRVELDNRGEWRVYMTIGKSVVDLSDVLALKLSAFLRHAGRRAKAENGGGKIWTNYADLTPENAEELNADMSVDRKRIYLAR